MGKPIELDVLANVRGFQKGTDDVADALDDVADALDDIVRDGDRASDELERSFRDLTRASSDTGRDIGKDFRDGFKRAEAGAGEFRDEANSTMRETAASISSVDDALDAVQEIAANAFAGFGPVGAGAGLVTALGLGLVTEELRKQDEEAAELKASLTGAYIAAADEGRNYLDVQQVIAEAAAIYEDTEGRLKTATEEAARLNIDRALVVQAMAGDEDAILAVIAAGNDKISERRDTLEDELTIESNRVGVIDTERGALENIVNKYEERLGIQQEAKANAEEYLGVVDAQGKEERDNIARAKAADAARWEAQAAAIQRARDLASQPATLEVRVSTAEAERRIRELTNRAYEVSVGVRYRNGKPVDR